MDISSLEGSILSPQWQDDNALIMVLQTTGLVFVGRTNLRALDHTGPDDDFLSTYQTGSTIEQRISNIRSRMTS